MKSRQRGVALLVVLLILALMVTVAAAIAERSGKALLRTGNQLSRQQAKWYALGAEAMAGQILLRDELAEPEHTHLAQNWAQQDRQFAVDGGEIHTAIQDGQACFNLNAINQNIGNDVGGAKAPYPARVFLLLLENLGEEPARAAQITAAVRDWIDSDGSPLANGAEDKAYASLPAPYRPANKAMSEISELRAVYGMDSGLYRRLQPYVCVLSSEAMRINVNTLRESQAPLLAALFLNQMTSSQAKALLQQRPTDGWDSLAALQQTGQLPGGNNTALTVLAVKSEWFFAQLSVRVGDSDFYQRSLFHLSGHNALVVRRQYGGYRTVDR
ncbi:MULTISPECIES: type II secretion system minor pseudopilin GspK [unclassified Brenneria]|uniref:type II secretion system minor pseudopilin GspK n=1 Tax=unclassified Brenneria TaxID=2634434 RepID=UPI00155223D3|nr:MULTISPECIES: type II secretion system minor pseudopilin GspK [unclassified Brenneria]MBJ7221458.1 type II secretion system minor pseudopilin GspK [Brenneria sp. L3-3C-1]MEE3642700.1 type II secretion system minor pseudopilin GspK [Brenneria sp. L3_3C_1]MEE3652613.1 type II secretion system minor pseudopilin GspK [Brenneria sp. HEZEL_4_2_4]NPD02571.1 type II secretion system minor pseudopilin GspK [Brenneria sp. hezel4-2-4]